MGLLVRVFTFLFNALPRRWALAFARRLGALLFRYSQLTRFKGSIERNIETAFGDRFDEAERHLMARRHIQDMMTTLVEVARIRELPRLVENGIVTTQGEERFRALVEQGKGAVVLGAHIGNWEMLLSAFGLLGYDAVVVVAKQPNPHVDRWLIRARERFGTRTVYYDEIKSSDVKAILDGGGILILLADQHNYGGPARNIVPFFGNPVSVPGGPVAYATRFGVPLVPVHTIRREDGRHLIVFEPPLPLLGPERPDYFQRNCERMIKHFEGWIEAHPGQWMWSNNRWAWLDKDLQPIDRVT